MAAENLKTTEPLLPTDACTGESYCPECGEPDPDISVEAFEVHDRVMCSECYDAKIEAGA